MNEKIDRIIEIERESIKELEKERDKLKSKWFKTSSVLKFTDFLERYLVEKRALIVNLEDIAGEYR